MANQNNNLVPPPINPPNLNIPPPNPQPQGNRPPPPIQPAFIASPESINIIAEVVNSIVRPDFDAVPTRDQAIRPELLNNLEELDKIPDVVRSLRDFSGKSGEFSSWRKSVERILKIYEPLQGTPKFYGILSIIRNKIIGDADAVLESYNTPLDWRAISKCLTLHYADKRDLGTLEYQMTSLVQGYFSVQEFYLSVGI